MRYSSVSWWPHPWSHDPTLVSENYYGRAPGMESSYLPDVYGVQLLPDPDRDLTKHLLRRANLGDR